MLSLEYAPPAPTARPWQMRLLLGAYAVLWFVGAGTEALFGLVFVWEPLGLRRLVDSSDQGPAVITAAVVVGILVTLVAWRGRRSPGWHYTTFALAGAGMIAALIGAIVIWMGPHSFLWAIAFFVALIVGGGCLLLIAAATCGWFACRGSPGPAIRRPFMNQVGVPPSRPER